MTFRQEVRFLFIGWYEHCKEPEPLYIPLLNNIASVSIVAHIFYVGKTIGLFPENKIYAIAIYKRIVIYALSWMIYVSRFYTWRIQAPRIKFGLLVLQSEALAMKLCYIPDWWDGNKFVFEYAIIFVILHNKVIYGWLLPIWYTNTHPILHFSSAFPLLFHYIAYCVNKWKTKRFTPQKHNLSWLVSVCLILSTVTTNT